MFPVAHKYEKEGKKLRELKEGINFDVPQEGKEL